MMVTWMEHPKHGKHPATGEEVEHLKANGWTLCQPKAKAQEPAPMPAADTDKPAQVDTAAKAAPKAKAQPKAKA